MRVFLSYRRADEPGGVGRLFDHLESHFGKGNVFLDVDSDMPLGVDFRDHIAAQVAQADAVLCVIGPKWLESIQEKVNDPKDFVRVEIESALERGIPVVPVLMGGVVPEETELPPSISRLAYLNGMPVDVGADFRHHVKTLCAKLEGSLGSSASSEVGQQPGSGKKEDGESGKGQSQPKVGVNWLDVLAILLGSLLGLYIFGLIAHQVWEHPISGVPGWIWTVLYFSIMGVGCAAGVVLVGRLRRMSRPAVVGALLAILLATVGPMPFAVPRDNDLWFLGPILAIIFAPLGAIIASVRSTRNL